MQTQVVSLQEHKDRCECTTLRLLQELCQVQASVQLQDSELKQLRQEMQQAAWAPEKEILEVSHHRLGGRLSPPTGQASPFLGVRADNVSWTLSPAQPLLPRLGAQRISIGYVCAGWAVRAPGLHLAHTLLLAVPQSPEPEPDAGPGQEVSSHLWHKAEWEGRGLWESSDWRWTYWDINHRILFSQ